MGGECAPWKRWREREKKDSRVAKHEGKKDEIIETRYNAVLRVKGGDNKTDENGLVDS